MFDIHTKGTTIINGNVYIGTDIHVIGNDIIVDGKNVGKAGNVSKLDTISIKIEGQVENISSDSKKINTAGDILYDIHRPEFEEPVILVNLKA